MISHLATHLLTSKDVNRLETIDIIGSYYQYRGRPRIAKCCYQGRGYSCDEQFRLRPVLVRNSK